MLLRRRLVLLFAANLAALVVVSSVAAVIIRDRDQIRGTERRLGVAQEQVAQLATAYSDQETGARGFVLGGDEVFLEPFDTGTERADRLTASLRATASEEPALRHPLAEVSAAARRWREEAAAAAIGQRNAGETAQAAATLTASGTPLFDAVRSRLDRLSESVAGAAAAADRRADDARSHLSLVLLVLVATALAGVLLASWCVRRWVTRPLARLGDQVRRTRVGEVGHTIDVADPPEIASLAADVDAMRTRIEAQRAEAERSRVSLEESAAVLLTVRAYLEPDVGPLPRGWTIAAQLRAAAGVVAGDCYDIVVLDADQVGLIVVDIAGHGAAEGILALRCKELLRAGLSAAHDPGAALTTAAEQLGAMGEEVFLTAFVGVIDTRSGEVRYANAGHPPAFIALADTWVDLGPTGPLMGLLGTGWTTRGASMSPGDTLCVYTDGLIETRNAEHEFFGPERLVDLVQGSRCDEAPAVVKRCIDEVQLFSPGGLRDDVTVVVVCRPDN
jgi:serine phosphatase RsbU (regulator of sigma subunit)/CHASE3 domain sensor protein